MIVSKPALQIALLGFVLICAVDAAAQKVRVALPDFSMSLIAFIAAQEKGFYRDEGLDTELIKMSAPVANLAMLAGNVEFGAAGAAAIPSVVRGAPLQFLFHTYQRPLYWLYARSDIRDIQGLKGKRVGVSGIGSGPDLLLRELLKKYGLDTARDVTIMGLGAGTARFAALKAGSVESAVLSPPSNFLAEENGFRELVSFVKEDLIELQSAVVVREGMPQSNPALVEKFVRATLKGFIYARDNRAGTIPILTKIHAGTPEIAAKTYDASRPAMTPDGTVAEELQKKTIEQAAVRLDLKELPPLKKIFDYSFTRKARAQLTAQGWKP